MSSLRCRIPSSDALRVRPRTCRRTLGTSPEGKGLVGGSCVRRGRGGRLFGEGCVALGDERRVHVESVLGVATHVSVSCMALPTRMRCAGRGWRGVLFALVTSGGHDAVRVLL
ncbi:hypothetical protein OG21DRAFT_897270 [Imleria badia]|nr:hypothetical protein OG21DRAFT_897270 [Imleria badia]